MAKSNFEKKAYWVIFLHQCLSLKNSQGRNPNRAGADAEAMEGRCLLA